MARISIFILFTALFLTGCVTNGQTPGQSLDAMTQSITDKVNALRGVATQPVALNFVGLKAFHTDDDRLQEVFVTLPETMPAPGEQETEAATVVKNLGDLLKANPRLTSYIYINPADMRSPLVNMYWKSLEAVSGPGRTNVKADTRLALTHTPLVWIADPALAASADAILSAEKNGLLVTKVPAVK